MTYASRRWLLLVPALAVAAAAARKPARSLRNKVVVITGASSGIGRAAALAFADRGCRLVLAARRTGLIEHVAEECRARGADAIAVTTDVTRKEDVTALRDAALERWGRIDIWVNNAAVTMYSPLEEHVREHQRVLETNLFGPLYAVRAVIPVFKAQHAGTMINVASILAKVGHALVPSYVISKHALQGLSEALRVQLADERDIHICTILPYAVDTPHFESAGNFIGRQPYALPPAQSPWKIARAIVSLAERPRRQMHVPHIAVLGLMLHAVFPRTTDQLLRRALLRFHLDGTQTPTEGGLFEPSPGPGTATGTRQPLVSTAGFLAWAFGELGAILAENAGVRRGGDDPAVAESQKVPAIPVPAR